MAISGFFMGQNIYTAMLVASTLEGMGFPVPAELLYLYVTPPDGTTSIHLMVLAATLGNLLGACTGFGVAYLGGPAVLARICRLVGISPEAVRRVDEFFNRYGALTVFLARFFGLIRAATVYSAGAARMAPWKFALYTACAALIWNTGWAYLAVQFGGSLPVSVNQWIAWAVAGLMLFLVGQLIWRWYRRRRPVGT